VGRRGSAGLEGVERRTNARRRRAGEYLVNGVSDAAPPSRSPTSTFVISNTVRVIDETIVG
jgi:hypothetical protein